MEIKEATLDEAKIIAELAIHMWNSHTIEELKLNFEGYIKSGGTVFLAWNSNEAVGFAQCGLSNWNDLAELKNNYSCPGPRIPTHSCR